MNDNPILKEDWKRSLMHSGGGALIGAGVGALGKGILNKFQGKKFSDDIGAGAGVGAGVGALAGNSAVRNYVNSELQTYKNKAVRAKNNIQGIYNFIKPGKKSSSGRRINPFRHKVIRNTIQQFSPSISPIINAAALNAARTYIFTSKSKLLNDLYYAYASEKDPQKKESIRQEIIKVKNASEDALKLKATVKGALWGSLVGAAYSAGKELNKQITNQQGLRNRIAPRIDKETGKLISSPTRLAHSATFGMLRKLQIAYNQQNDNARKKFFDELVSRSKDKSKETMDKLWQAAMDKYPVVTMDQVRNLAARSVHGSIDKLVNPLIGDI